MALTQARTMPGVLELLPLDQIAFQDMLDAVRRNFERFGFLPIETPVMEFTDVLLTRGAVRVYAVDVGYGQLADRLRADERVVSMERVNARSLTASSLPEPATWLAIVIVVLLGVIAAAASGRLQQPADQPRERESVR